MRRLGTTTYFPAAQFSELLQRLDGGTMAKKERFSQFLVSTRMAGTSTTIACLVYVLKARMSNELVSIVVQAVNTRIVATPSIVSL